MLLRSLILMFFFSLPLLGHSIKAAYLEITYVGDNSYKTKWKVPLKNAPTTSLSPQYPHRCQEFKKDTYKDSNVIFTTSSLQCKETLLGQTISINNIANETRRVIFHFEENSTSFFDKLSPSNPSLSITNSIASSGNTLNYITLGIEHILLGYDHLLFILGLLLLIKKFKILIQTITAFTLAHSITLGASALGFISMPELFIEIIIALSIVILAVEILYTQKGKYGFSSKYPWIVALFFGLIHGFGFANVLAELTLPKAHILQALLFFNVGIELGQILFISLFFSLYYLLKLLITDKHISQGKTLISYLIGAVSSFWFIERFMCIFAY